MDVIPFTCPRCGYKTLFSTCMMNHLHKRKKPCLPILSNTQLSDEIKNIIMSSRVYNTNVSLSQPQQIILMVKLKLITLYVI